VESAAQFHLSLTMRKLKKSLLRADKNSAVLSEASRLQGHITRSPPGCSSLVGSPSSLHLVLKGLPGQSSKELWTVASPGVNSRPLS
jgi:hypothetical protein